jgi:hypothetical protein
MRWHMLMNVLQRGPCALVLTAFAVVSVTGRGEEVSVNEYRPPSVCLRKAAEAANEEDLASYVSCFSSECQGRVRQQAGLLFATHDLSLDLRDSHVLSESARSAEVAVNYDATLTAATFRVISLVSLKRERDGWKIQRERVQAIAPIASGGVPSASGPTCLGGACAVRSPCAGGRCGVGSTSFDVKAYLNGN